MPVTVKVNGVANSLVHKGSVGVSVATIPDVCKTPSPGGPIPIPYPNVSQSITLAKGTTSVKADGGMMIANKGSEFSLSNGDNAGVAGGVKSSTFMKESTWITYSFDVKMQGKGAARLTDKKFQNHENTCDLSGVAQPPIPLEDLYDALHDIAKCCSQAVDCSDESEKRNKGCRVRGIYKHSCCEQAIKRRAGDSRRSPSWAHVGSETRHDEALPFRACRLDVQVPLGAQREEVQAIFDFKFNCTTTPTMSRAQARRYRERFPNALLAVIGRQGHSDSVGRRQCVDKREECDC